MTKVFFFGSSTRRCSVPSKTWLASFRLWMLQRTISCWFPWPYRAYWVLSNRRRVFFWWFIGYSVLWKKWQSWLDMVQLLGHVASLSLGDSGGSTTYWWRNSTDKAAWSRLNVFLWFKSESWRSSDCALAMYGNFCHCGWLQKSNYRLEGVNDIIQLGCRQSCWWRSFRYQP